MNFLFYTTQSLIKNKIDQTFEVLVWIFSTYFFTRSSNIFLMISTYENILYKTFSSIDSSFYFHIFNHSLTKKIKIKVSRKQKKLLNCYHLLYHLSNEIWSIIQRIFHKYGYDKRKGMLKYRMSNHLCWYWLFIYWFEWLIIMKIFFYSL